MQNMAHSITKLDRRNAPRTPVNYLADIYKNKKHLYATVLNISEHGLGIRTPCSLKPGEVFKLKINCYHTLGKIIIEQFNLMLTAQTIWTIEEREKMFKCGLRILNTNGDNIHKLKNHIQILFLQRVYQ